jgi:hypothetical protein
MGITRRHFLQMITAGVALAGLRPAAADWEAESPAAAAIRAELEALFGGRQMALDFRGISPTHDEQFRIQINAFDLLPVASCFKTWLILYYFLYTPAEDWDTHPGSPAYETAVNSGNLSTGVLLAEVAQRLPGQRNPIEKFNDFLRRQVGMARSGLHTWNWPLSPTVGLSDPRYAPSEQRQMRGRAGSYRIDNLFTAADMGRGWDVLARGVAFSRQPRLRAALQATLDLLAIPASNYQSPIERVYPMGYIGKDGILPSGDTPAGRVIADAGLLNGAKNRYIVVFMSAGESEVVAVEVLRQVVAQIAAYEAATTI